VEVQDDDYSLHVGFVRGVWNALHHVLVKAEADRVVVTVFLGNRPEVDDLLRERGEVAVVAVGIPEWTAVRSAEPIRGRPIQDGGASPVRD
jgi:hypothetical protein